MAVIQHGRIGWSDRGSQLRVSSRIQQVNNPHRIDARLGRVNGSGGGSDRDNVESRIKQRHRDCNGVVDSGVTVDDDLSGHAIQSKFFPVAGRDPRLGQVANRTGVELDWIR